MLSKCDTIEPCARWIVAARRDTMHAMPDVRQDRAACNPRPPNFNCAWQIRESICQCSCIGLGLAWLPEDRMCFVSWWCQDSKCDALNEAIHLQSCSQCNNCVVLAGGPHGRATARAEINGPRHRRYSRQTPIAFGHQHAQTSALGGTKMVGRVWGLGARGLDCGGVSAKLWRDMAQASNVGACAWNLRLRFWAARFELRRPSCHGQRDRMVKVMGWNPWGSLAGVKTPRCCFWSPPAEDLSSYKPAYGRLKDYRLEEQI